MIKDYSLMLLQKAIEQALKLDPSTPAKIEAFHGKVIEIIVSPLRVYFYMIFEHQTLKLQSQYSGPIDTVIHSSPLGLIRLSLLPASKLRSLFNDQVKMSGDLVLGQNVKKLFDELHIDWEGHLAYFTGDVIAHQIGTLARKGLNFKRQLQTSLQHQLTEYIQEEAKISPSREEMNDFMNDVDELSLRVERIEAHINHYLAQHETH